MGRFFSGVFLALFLIIVTPTAYAAGIQMKIDGFAIDSDVKPEIKNNRTMVPLRIIGENLGAKVNWSDSNVILTKGKMQITLKINSSTAMKNGKAVLLDVKPYIRNNSTFVPLRVITETFGCNINYRNTSIDVQTEPLVIEGVKVKALQQEYYYIMGGLVNQIKGNSYIEAIYNIFVENKGSKVQAPSNYMSSIASASHGDYYNNGQYDFLDQEGKSIKRYDIYSLIGFSSARISDGAPEFLIYAVHEDEWYLFNKKASQSIYQLIDTATKNGFLTTISNTTP